jgi:glycosyltransferase involved in cell wall biosynthesis
VKILCAAQCYVPYLDKGGLPTKVRSLSRSLSASGHKVTVLTAYFGDDEWKQQGLLPEPSDCGVQYREDGVSAVYLPTWLRYRALTLNPGVVRFSRSALEEFDLVHVFGLYDLLGPSVTYFCRQRRIPYIVEPMGMFLPIDRSLLAKRVWHATVGSAFWRDASLIVATSELEQEELLRSGVRAEKVVVRYNGIDAIPKSRLPARGGFRRKHSIPANEPLLFFLSRLIPRKGAEILIESFAEVCPSSGRLVIAGPEGEPGYLSRLKECARTAGVADRVIFQGALYGEEKFSALADSDIFVLPSRYENFANAAAEAIACGVPVIVSRYCGIRTLVEGRAGLVIEPDRTELSTALRSLLKDPGLYARLREGCQGVAGQLSWEQIAKEMETHYKEVLAKGHAAN